MPQQESVSFVVALALFPVTLCVFALSDLQTVAVFVLGCLTTYLITRHYEVDESLPKHGQESSSRLYGMDHGILNIRLPLQTMWMNMGYWENTQDFSQACQSLLDQVLKAAGVGPGFLGEREYDTGFFLLDLGYGCGDQTLHMANIMESYRGYSSRSRYIGITLDGAQYRLAKERVGSETNGPNQLFCADAANPTTWTSELRNAISESLEVVNGHSSQHRWLLALDTLYHFRPSREAIFHNAAKGLDASIMAFDLLLAENISGLDKILLRLISRLLSAPFSNFMNQEDYRAQLGQCGYDREKVAIQDISQHVFQGLSDFLVRQDAGLRQIGVTSFMRFRLAGRLFRWFAKGNVVRACIVVAKK